MSSRTSLACVLLTVFTGLEVGAQQIAGSIRGTVVDPSGAVVQSASKEVQFRGELFNLLNHTKFRLPVSDISAPSTAFGHIQSDVSPRVIQVALKFLF